MDMKPKPATETSREKAYRRLQDVLDMCDLTNGNSDNALCVQQAMDNLRLINFSSASIQAIQVLVENLIYRFIGHKLNNSVAQAYKDCRSRLRDIDDNKPG